MKRKILLRIAFLLVLLITVINGTALYLRLLDYRSGEESYQQIRDACRCGSIAAVKSTGDGKWYLNRSSLEEYVEKRQRR